MERAIGASALGAEGLEAVSSGPWAGGGGQGGSWQWAMAGKAAGDCVNLFTSFCSVIII